MEIGTTAVRTTLEQRRFWAYAAAFGASWGVLEITLGSFLHNLRLPLSGFALTALGAALLVAERQLLPVRGLTAATGLVACACKSVSPGGVIFGPMIAIACEALLVELALVGSSRARPAALLAGLLAIQWTATQAVLSQYLLYGGSVVELYLAALRRAAGTLGWSDGAPWLVAGLGALLTLFGASAGLLGRRVGLGARQRLTDLQGRPTP